MEKFAAILVRNGYKVVVVEQVSKKTEKSNALVEREVVQIITRGTINFTFEENNHDPKFLLAIRYVISPSSK